MAKCNIKSTFCLSMVSLVRFDVLNFTFRSQFPFDKFMLQAIYVTDHCIRDILTNKQVCRQSMSSIMWVASSEVLDPGEILILLTHCRLSGQIQRVCHLGDFIPHYWTVALESFHKNAVLTLRSEISAMWSHKENVVLQIVDLPHYQELRRPIKPFST